MVSPPVVKSPNRRANFPHPVTEIQQHRLTGEEVLTVTRSRRGRDPGTKTTRDEVPGDQQCDRVRSQDDPEVFEGNCAPTDLWSSGSSSEQTGSVQMLHRQTLQCGCVECCGAAARVTRAWLRGRVHDLEGLSSAAATRSPGGGRAAL